MKQVTLGYRRPGLLIQRRDVGDLIAYISHKSGEYDLNERGMMDDAYVLGFDAHRAGLSLEAALIKHGGRLRARKEFIEQRRKLVKKGWDDYENG